jgi:hypothetical protein
MFELDKRDLPEFINFDHFERKFTVYTKDKDKPGLYKFVILLSDKYDG